MAKDPKRPWQRMLTVEQIAEADHVSPRTVRRWLESGDLPFVKLSSLVRIRVEDHEAFLARNRAVTGVAGGS
jgi:excisionase family DNA binding protein